MSSDQVLQLGSTHVLLLPERALYWPEHQMLCVADAHFGKAAAYRAQGQPVPGGTTQDNLARLDAVLVRHSCRRLVFLGDFLHARAARTPEVLDALQQWRETHATVACTLVRGNHDRHAGDPPARLRFEMVDEPLVLGPLVFRHIPGPSAAGHVLAGHVHPVFKVHGRGRQQVRLPCFYHANHMTLLPAFGDFTGGQAVYSEPGCRIFITDGKAVRAIPPARSALLQRNAG